MQFNFLNIFTYYFIFPASNKRGHVSIFFLFIFYHLKYTYNIQFILQVKNYE